MEKVIETLGTFFDVKSFSVKRLIIAALVLASFYILRGLFSTIIIKIFKVKGKINIKSNNFYNPLHKPNLKPIVLANRLKTILTLFSKNNSIIYLKL